MQIKDRLIYQAVLDTVPSDLEMSRSTVLDLVKVEKKSEKEILRTFRKWTVPVVRTLGKKSPSRFNELKRSVKGISSTSLSERLSSLEREGILQRVVIPDNPPRVEYTLTSKGLELNSIILELDDWIHRWNEQ